MIDCFRCQVTVHQELCTFFLGNRFGSFLYEIHTWYQDIKHKINEFIIEIIVSAEIRLKLPFVLSCVSGKLMSGNSWADGVSTIINCICWSPSRKSLNVFLCSSVVVSRVHFSGFNFNLRWTYRPMKSNRASPPVGTSPPASIIPLCWRWETFTKISTEKLDYFFYISQRNLNATPNRLLQWKRKFHFTLFWKLKIQCLLHEKYEPTVLKANPTTTFLRQSALRDHNFSLFIPFFSLVDGNAHHQQKKKTNKYIVWLKNSNFVLCFMLSRFAYDTSMIFEFHSFSFRFFLLYRDVTMRCYLFPLWLCLFFQLCCGYQQNCRLCSTFWLLCTKPFHFPIVLWLSNC